MALCGILRQSTAVDILLGPFVEDGDGDTATTGLTLDVELSKNGQPLADSESAAPTHDAAGTVDGYYNCILGTTDTNTVGILTVVAHHADALPIRQDYQVMEEGIYDALFKASAPTPGAAGGLFIAGTNAATVITTSLTTGAITLTTPIEANATQISGDATAADNLELQYDTTGLTGDTFPATQSGLAGITNTGSAVNTTAASYTLTTGTQSSGTYTSTAALDSTNHEHTDDGGVMELYYQFEIGSGIPTSATMTGYLNSSNDDLSVWGYDWVATAWVQVGTLEGKNASSNEVNSYELFTNMVGSAANEGIVRIRFYAASGLSTATLAIDQIFCSFSRGNEGYDNGAVWIDTNESNTNTVVGIDGTARNPVSTIAAVNTLLASTNLSKVEIAPGSSITLAATQANQAFYGERWTLALGGQDIAGSHFHGADVSGTATGATKPDFEKCHFGTTTLPPSELHDCGLEGTITAGSAGEFCFRSCHSNVAGAGTPVFDFGTGLNSSNVHFRDYSGGIEIAYMGAGTGTYTMSLEGNGQLIIASTCSPTSTIVVRGNFTVTDNVAGGFVTGGGTLSDDARYDVAQINTECDSALSDYAPATAAVLGAAAGATISADIADIPTVAEFEARTIVSADYVVVGDTIAGVTLLGGLAANTITAASINADAITSAKIADDALSSEHINTGAFTADAFAADALVAATFATDSIAADALAADALTEIQASCNSALVANNLDHLMLTVLSGGASPTYSEIVDGTALSWIMTKTGDPSDFVASTDSLEALQTAATGTGATTYTLTVDDGTNPIDNVTVWITTDVGGSSVVANSTTNSSGVVVFQLDNGTYYAWKQHGGYNFTNPETITVTSP